MNHISYKITSECISLFSGPAQAEDEFENKPHLKLQHNFAVFVPTGYQRAPLFFLL